MPPDLPAESDVSSEQIEAFKRLVEERCVRHSTLRAPVAVEISWKLADAAAAG